VCVACNARFHENQRFCQTCGGVLVEDPSGLVGTTFDGLYRVEKLLGWGGMGAVYKARHALLNECVALKILRKDMSTNAQWLGRFLREGQAACQIRHPNAVDVRDLRTASDGTVYMVLEYVEGHTLREHMQQGARFAPGLALQVLEPVASVLDEAHRHGIVHRDVKPDNVMIGRDSAGQPIVKVLDLGIAKLREMAHVGPDPTTSLTLPGQIIGTPHYMSPEQWGEIPRDGSSTVDGRADVYSLGVMAYEMLSGRKPFTGATLQEIRRAHVKALSTPVHEVVESLPHALGLVTARALAADRADRYGTAGEFVAALKAATQAPAEGASAPPAGVREGEAPAPAAGVTQKEFTAADALPTPVPDAESGGTPSTFEAPGARPRRRIPRRALWAAGAAALAALALLLLPPSREATFTVVVRGVPPNGGVYIDGVRQVAPRTDGTVTVPGVPAGSRHVRVTGEGGAVWETTVDATEGQVRSLDAQLAPAAAPAALPAEVDYGGQMVLVAAGTFVLGDDNHLPNEKPAHEVFLPDYYIDRFEVTNGQFRRFCDDTGRPYPTRYPQLEVYFRNNPDSPVLGVSRDEAEAYSSWAGKRLPDEAEWEKAASWDPVYRQKRQWPWGNSPVKGAAVLEATYPAPVAQGSGASAYGVHGMAGNAAEWVAGYYQPYPGNEDPDPEYEARLYVLRGGAFQSRFDDARTTRRLPQPAQRTEEEMRQGPLLSGFRCAVSADDPAFREYLRAHALR
jgi:serine/threonine-protein kinase